MIRPGDANETAEAWRVAVEQIEGPVVLVPTRQEVPTFDRRIHPPARSLERGAYALTDPAGAVGAVGAVVHTGSEVSVALAAARLLTRAG